MGSNLPLNDIQGLSPFAQTIRSILTPLKGKFCEDTQKKGKGAKAGASHDWRSFYLSQYDWLKGSHMTKGVWLPNETDYSYCDFVGAKYSLLKYLYPQVNVKK